MSPGVSATQPWATKRGGRCEASLPIFLTARFNGWPLRILPQPLLASGWRQVTPSLPEMPCVELPVKHGAALRLLRSSNQRWAMPSLSLTASNHVLRTISEMQHWLPLQRRTRVLTLCHATLLCTSGGLGDPRVFCSPDQDVNRRYLARLHLPNA